MTVLIHLGVGQGLNIRVQKRISMQGIGYTSSCMYRPHCAISIHYGLLSVSGANSRRYCREPISCLTSPE